MSDVPFEPLRNDMILKTADVRAAEVTLAPRTDTPPHLHSMVDEHCYCLEGVLTVETPGSPQSTLTVGDSAHFPAGFEHQLSNQSDAICRVLVIHGIGQFDFIMSRKDHWKYQH